MFIALDEEGKRTPIASAFKGEKYFCPICHKKLIIKAGKIVAHHFAHKSTDNCLDSWHHDMSFWHYDWQNKFPKESQEIVMRDGDEIHRADVFLSETNTIIEFQHSFINKDEFQERNEFYLKKGYQLVWLFDVREDVSQGRLTNIKNSPEKFKYLFAPATFKDFTLKDNISIFFHLRQNDLCKVNWISPQGIKYFAGSLLSSTQFIEIMKGNKTYDDLVESNKKENEITQKENSKTKEISFHNKSLVMLYEKSGNDIVIFENTKTLKKVLITTSPKEQYQKYHHVYGKISDSFGEFSKPTTIIESALEPEWRIIWKKKRDKEN